MRESISFVPTSLYNLLLKTQNIFVKLLNKTIIRGYTDVITDKIFNIAPVKLLGCIFSPLTVYCIVATIARDH